MRRCDRRGIDTRLADCLRKRFLQSTVGLMAGGWDGAPAGEAPGFPRDGTWTVRAEGLNQMP